MSEQNGELLLTRAEAIAFKGLLQQERLLKEEIARASAPLAQDREELSADVEQRLGLEPGALSSTHQIDLERRLVTVVEKD